MRRARSLGEALWLVSPEAWDEARIQAGLPEVWSWDYMRGVDAYRFSIACQIRLLAL